MWLSVGILADLSAWILYELKKRFHIDMIAWTWRYVYNFHLQLSAFCPHKYLNLVSL